MESILVPQKLTAGQLAAFASALPPDTPIIGVDGSSVAELVTLQLNMPNGQLASLLIGFYKQE